MRINPRRPYDLTKPTGLLESDKDYALNNLDACVLLLDSEVRKQGLTFTVEDTACSYRLNGVLIDRLAIKTSHPHEHMIAVIKRLREYHGEDPGYSRCRDLWDNRKEMADA